MREYDRDELLALTPERYLADGYLDGAGQPRRELQTDYATAAATQLLAAELAPQEFAFTYEALRIALPLHDGPPRAQAEAALEEALAVVGRMIKQPNNEGLERWLRSCVSQVTAPGDIAALLDHVQAVLRLHSVFAALPEREPDSSSPPASSAS